MKSRRNLDGKGLVYEINVCALPSCGGNEYVIQVISRSQGPTLPVGGQQEQRTPWDLSDPGVIKIVDVP